MDKIVKNRWQVRVAALAIFMLGVAAGALGLNAYRGLSRASDDRPRGGGFEQILDRLELSAEQKVQVQQILTDTRRQLGEARKESEPRMKDIRRQTDERLQQVLTPEQWQKFQQLKEEMRGRRRGRSRRGDGPGSGGAER